MNPKCKFIPVANQSHDFTFRFSPSQGEGSPRNDAVWIVFLIAFLLWPGAAHAVVPTIEEPIVQLRVLDKVTARVEELEAPINKPVTFGTIIITARACRTTPPEDTPEIRGLSRNQRIETR